jgi:hypothetical protein
MFCCKKEKDKVNKNKSKNKIHPEKEFKSIPILKNNDKKVPRRESIYPKVNRFKSQPDHVTDDAGAVVCRESIYPKVNKKQLIEVNKLNVELQKEQKEAFTDKFLAEIINCGHCKEKFSLGDRIDFISCGTCNNFFHCGIAGACVGPKCSVIYEGKNVSMKYCKGCVNPYLKINVLDNGQSLCKICEIDPKIDRKFLAV